MKDLSALTTGGGRLAGVDVADDDDVDMNLLFTIGNCECALLYSDGTGDAQSPHTPS